MVRTIFFCPYGPDWRDNKALVSYYNPILPCQYRSTELLRFVIDALQYRQRGAKHHWLMQWRSGLEAPINKTWLADLRLMQQRLARKTRQTCFTARRPESPLGSEV